MLCEDSSVIELGADGTFDLPGPKTIVNENQSASLFSIDPHLARIRLPFPSVLKYSSAVVEEAVSNVEKKNVREYVNDADPEREDFYSDVSESEDESFHDVCETVEDISKDAKKADEMKEQGNKFYLSRSYLDAMDCYTLALDFCPTSEEYKEKKAIFFCNRAACSLKLEDFERVVADCSDALALKQDYVKALIRRSEANEKLEKFDIAIEDLNKVIGICAPEVTAAVIYKANSDIERLKVLHEKKMEEMKEEAIEKLKELGNTMLGYFGMSLDNFKVNQNPEGGGYNISFNK